MAIAWFLVVSPRRAEAAQVQAQVLSQQQQNDQSRIAVEQLKAEFVQLPAARAKLAEIRGQMPPTEDVPGLLRMVEGLATAAGVSLLSFSPSAVQALSAKGAPITTGQGGAVLMALPLTMTINGEYFQVVTFMRQLQTGVSRAFLVTGLQIAKKDGDSSGGVAVTLNAEVFSMPSSSTSAGTVASSTLASNTVATATVTPTSTSTAPPVSTPASTPASTPSPTGAIALPKPVGSTRW
jgi:Tfp pilus assembly protein PilO